MNTVTEDGYILVHLDGRFNPESMEPEGPEVDPVNVLSVSFTVLRGWSDKPNGLFLEFEDRRIFIPWQNILGVEVFKNSKEVVEALDKQKTHQSIKDGRAIAQDLREAGMPESADAMEKLLGTFDPKVGLTPEQMTEGLKILDMALVEGDLTDLRPVQKDL